MGLTVEKCLQAWTNSLKQMNAKADIVFFGDSLTFHGDFASVFPDKVVCNLGLRGDTIQGMIKRVELVKILAPKAVYLMAGINDIASTGIREFEEQYEYLLMSLMEALPDADLIIHGLLPVNDIDFSISCNNNQIVEYNRVIKKVSSIHGFKYIDLYAIYLDNGILNKCFSLDGIHLNTTGYLLWYSLLREFQIGRK